MSLWVAVDVIAELLKTGGQRKIIEFLQTFSLEQRRQIISIKHYYLSVFFVAIRKRYTSLVIYLLESCVVDPNSLGWMAMDKISGLILATMDEDPVFVKAFLKHGANTEVTGCYDAKTALYHACNNGDLDIVKMLINHGADVNSRDSEGNTCLMVSIRNSTLSQGLIFSGADVNAKNCYGETALLLALETQSHTMVSFLLDMENINIRIKTNFEEDCLQYAIKFDFINVLGNILRKGSYTLNEVINAFEMQSGLLHVMGFHEKATDCWKTALLLSGKPRNIPEFEHQRSGNTKLQEVIIFFNTNDINALLYLESKFGLKSMFTLYVYIKAASQVDDPEKLIVICNFFLKILYSLDDRSFFMANSHINSLLAYILKEDKIKTITLETFKLLANYIQEIYTRLTRITPRERIHHGDHLSSILDAVLAIFKLSKDIISKKGYLFYDVIKKIINIDLRDINQRKLLHLCVGLEECLIEPIFLLHGDNVNSTDQLGKSILHYLIENKTTNKQLFKSIIDKGFDFSRVKYDEYCLPCVLNAQQYLPKRVKHISLQCLAARAFCKNTMGFLNDVPPHLIPIVKSHVRL